MNQVTLLLIAPGSWAWSGVAAPNRFVDCVTGAKNIAQGFAASLGRVRETGRSRGVEAARDMHGSLSPRVDRGQQRSCRIRWISLSLSSMGLIFRLEPRELATMCSKSCCVTPRAMGACHAIVLAFGAGAPVGPWMETDQSFDMSVSSMTMLSRSSKWTSTIA